MVGAARPTRFIPLHNHAGQVVKVADIARDERTRTNHC